MCRTIQFVAKEPNFTELNVDFLLVSSCFPKYLGLFNLEYFYLLLMRFKWQMFAAHINL